MKNVYKLRDAIIVQAVDDYCTAVNNIMKLMDACAAREKIIKEAQKGKAPKYLIEQEAEKERLLKIAIQESRMQDVIRFFDSEWYMQLTTIPAKFMKEAVKTEAIDRIVEKQIYMLKKVTPKNVLTKKSQKTLYNYEVFKDFLKSGYVTKLTGKEPEYYLEKIKTESECDFL